MTGILILLYKYFVILLLFRKLVENKFGIDAKAISDNATVLANNDIPKNDRKMLGVETYMEFPKICQPSPSLPLPIRVKNYTQTPSPQFEGGSRGLKNDRFLP